MDRRFLTILLAASIMIPSAAAFGQAGVAADGAQTNLAPLIVTGRRAPPAEILPDVTTCLQAIRDPHTRAVMAAGGVPFIYLPTRPTRNPDYNAPPRTEPGSALPKVMSLKEYQVYARQYRDVVSLSNTFETPMPDGVADIGDDIGGESGAVDAARMATLSLCMDADANPRFSSGSGNRISNAYNFSSLPPTNGGPRLLGAFRDKNLPLAFALFEDGRYEEALRYFKAYHQKFYSPEAVLTIGKIYLFGLKERSNPTEGVRWLKIVAGGRFDSWRQMPVFDPRQPERNTAMGEAAMILAEVYRDGRGPVARDPALSRRYLERAYEVGHIAAAKALGDIYYEGRDTPRDLKKAFYHYRDGAKFAHVPAVLALAQMYDSGEAPGGRDPVKALAWRNEAAKFDDPTALYALAGAYDRGEGVAADSERALELYKLAAMNGEPGAQTALGTYFYRGEAPLPRDHELARRWFRQGALGGDPDSLFNLAAMMAKGEGGEVDRVGAVALLKLAERAQHPNAPAAMKAIEAQFTARDRARMQETAGASTAP